MREELKALDDLDMGDLWQRVRSRKPGPDDPDPRRPWKTRTVTYLLSAAALALVVLIVATLLPLGDERPTPASVGISPTQSPSATPPAEAGTVPTTLVLECGPGGATSVSPQVEASADGVHVEITGGSPEVMFKGWGGVFINGTAAGLVLDISPGPHAVRCGFGQEDRTGDYHPFEVLDPAGLWVDPTLDCPGQSMEVEYVNNEALHIEGDPSDEMTAFTKKEFAGRFPEAGSVIPVGYPEADRPYFGYVSSSGSVLGIVGFHEGLPGDWLPEFYRACKF